MHTNDTPHQNPAQSQPTSPSFTKSPTPSRPTESSSERAIQHPPAPRRPVDRLHVDLRRRAAREHAQRLLNLASDLDPKDQVVLRSVLVEGRTILELASIARVNTKTMHKRVRRLLDRLSHPMTSFIVSHRDHWPRDRRAAATLVLIEGVSLREAAERLDMTLHSLRRHIDRVHAMFEAITG
jgi:DNA-directed RNA polymerase specialized sigma24 family protein